MIFNFQVINYLKSDKAKAKNLSYNEEDEGIYENDTFIANLDDFTEQLRKESHCSFETIYSDVLLNTVLRCTECGTIIFTGDDELFDPDLCCPTCSDYYCHSEYFTKEEIENNPEKKELVKFYINTQKEENERQEWAEKIRAKHRKKKKDYLTENDVCGTKICFGLYMINLKLYANARYWNKLSKLFLKIEIFKKDKKEDSFYFSTKFISIPITPKAIHGLYKLHLYNKNKKEKE